MISRSDRTKPTKRTVVWKKACNFCKEGRTPSLEEHLELRRFVSDRGSILPRLKTGLCSSHQRLVSKSIKQARELALTSISKR